MFDNKVIFFIITVIATKRKRLHLKIKVSKAMFYIAQNQINMKMNLSSLPFKKKEKIRKKGKKELNTAQEKVEKMLQGI